MASLVIRLAAYVAPIMAAWLMVRLASQWFVGGDGWSGVALWLAQAIPVALATSLVAERFTRRLLPLATLLSLSLAFPDQAPSKFSVALRAGSTRQLEARVSELRSAGLGSDAGEAVAAALELVAALSLHDRRTRGHTERVRAYADLIAGELDLPPHDRARLAWGVLLHDVGKLTVPPEILNKTEPLSEAEWGILRGHPEASDRILEPLADWLGSWVRAGVEHHERWDGKGYPFGLAGDEISMAGRITAVADAYDVITSKRSYKESISAEAARRELVRCAGTHFDPMVVRAFINASVGQRRNAGPLAWLPEFRSLGQISSSLSTAGTTVVAAGTSTLAVVAGAVPILDPGPPDFIAYAESFAPIESAADVPVADEVVTTMVAGPPDDNAMLAPSRPRPSISSTAVPTSSTTGSPSTSRAPSTTPTTATQAESTSITTPAVPPTSTSSTTAPPGVSSMNRTTSAPPATSPPPSGPVSWSLGSGGFTTAQPVLPVGGPLASGSLPNYDTDRDDEPGLVVKKGGGLFTNNQSKMQRWVVQPGPVAYRGTPTLAMRVAVEDFDSDDDEDGDSRVAAGLYDCDAAYGDCDIVSAAAAPVDHAAGDFGTTTMTFTYLDHVVDADRVLVLKVVPGIYSDDDLWLAYGTTTYDSVLSIN